MNGLGGIANMILSLIFGIIIFVLWLRIAIRFFRVNPFNSVAQVIYRITNPVLQPIIKTFRLGKIQSGKYDWTCFALLITVTFIKFILINLMFYKGLLSAIALVILTLGDLIIQPCNFLFYAVILRVIISWVSPGVKSPIVDIAYAITETMLYRCRELLPDTAGLDFSPIVLLLILKIITILVSANIPIGIEGTGF